MPELPEVEITARLLDRELRGARIESVLAPGINALKTFAPPLTELAGQRVKGVRRRGKHLILDADGGLSLLMHLMSAGRLQLYDKRAGARDRTSRLLVRLDGERRGAHVEETPASDRDGTGAGRGERELRLREFGSKQAAWVKLLPTDELEQDPALATLGPEAWPDPPALEGLLDTPRPLHALLRDQRTIAGIGRSWVDEILWTAELSPFRQGSDLEHEDVERLHGAMDEVLGGALEHYERVIGDSIPDKAPMPLKVHRHQGEACPRCGTKIEAVHFKDYVMCYCPGEQTGGRVLKDRRLSKLLK